MEVEAPDEATVLATLARLGMENEPIEKKSYAALLSEQGGAETA